MKRALLSAFVVAVLVSSLPARADDPSSRTTLAGEQVALAGGGWFATPNGPVDRELARGGWAPLPRAVPDAAIRFGLTFFDISLDIHFAGIDAGLDGPTGSHGTLYRTAIGVDLGTRLRLGHGFAIAPFVGLGTLDTNLCLVGRPSTRSAPSASPFAQVALNPGGGTCLDAQSSVFDVGLTWPWVYTFRASNEHGDLAERSTLSIGPKLVYSFGLAGGRTWTTEPEGDSSPLLRRFSGPDAPIGGAYVGLELQYTFGVVRSSPQR